MELREVAQIPEAEEEIRRVHRELKDQQAERLAANKQAQAEYEEQRRQVKAAEDEKDLKELLDGGETRDCLYAKDLVAEFPDETATQILVRLDAYLDSLPQPKPPKTFNSKKGQRPAHRVSSQAIPRVRLKNYPDYQIDSHGAVYDMAGKLIAPRWRNGKCWVNLWTHDGKRVSRNVYWLMVDAGFVVLSEKEKAWRSKRSPSIN
jgi:hypothetical protein